MKDSGGELGRTESSEGRGDNEQLMEVRKLVSLTLWPSILTMQVKVSAMAEGFLTISS